MRARIPPWALSAGLAIAYLAIAPPSKDLAAQEYRVDLFDRAGLALWDNGWYGGHHLLGYSVLFPPLGGWLGPRLAGALAAVAAAWLFERIAREHWPARGGGAQLGAWWFAAASAVSLVTGRLTFALGLAFALAAVLAATRRRTGWAAAAAAGATLASPIAGLFVGLGAAGWLVAGPRDDRPRALALGAAAVVPALALALAFPEPGTEPFVASAFWPALAALLAILWALPRGERVLRAVVALYVLATIASFALDTPMGGNVTRLGALLAGPVLACVLWPRHARALVVLALPLLYWQWYPPVRDWASTAGDPSIHQRYYAGMLGFLEARQRAEGPFRVEVPFTDDHWEARWVAPRVPLARGWERQLDVRRNALFYDAPLTPATYRRWLRANAVRYVAVPDVALDAAGRGEARLIAAGLPYLHAVWRDAHWRVYAVRGAAPLADSGRVTGVDADGFTVALPAGGGTARVRIRWTRWWRVTDGAARLREGAADTTLVTGRGTVTVRARLVG